MFDGGGGNSSHDGSEQDASRRVIHHSNDAILKQFEVKKIKREYSRSQARTKVTSGVSGLTLAGVDWGGMVSAAAHKHSPGEGGGAAGSSTTPERKERSRRRLQSADNLLLCKEEPTSQKAKESRADRRMSTHERRLSQRVLNVDGVGAGSQRALSADSALSPSKRAAGEKYKNRRTSSRDLMSHPDLLAPPDKSTYRSRRSVKSADQVSSSENGSTQQRRARNRRGKSGERQRKGSSVPRRPRSERNLSANRPQRHHSTGKVGPRNAGTGAEAATTVKKEKDALRSSRSESPTAGRKSRRSSNSPHPASTRGLAAASSTTLERRATKNPPQARSRRGSFDMGQGEKIAKQSSIRW